MDLDDTRRAILDAAGHLLIGGGPGSGKTTIALLKAARTLESLEPEQRVVFLSFSRAAVRQISDRVAEQLPRALRDHLEIRTFHAFFLDLVRAHGPLLTGTPAAFLPPDAEAPRKADHNGDWDAETRELAHRGIYVFDQLAPVTATLLERSPALRRLYSDRYPLVIVDEFQDTNLDQWRVIQELAQGSTIICLADPDQRIYEGFIPGVDEARLQQAIDILKFRLAARTSRSTCGSGARGPSRRGGNVVSIDSGSGLANATILQRLVPVRLFYEFLMEEGLRQSNPVGRGRYTPGRLRGGRQRGLVPRLTKLPLDSD
jgi:ATP-dependent DNA helicase UvrD/PcrA